MARSQASTLSQRTARSAVTNARVVTPDLSDYVRSRSNRTRMELDGWTANTRLTSSRSHYATAHHTHTPRLYRRPVAVRAVVQRPGDVDSVVCFHRRLVRAAHDGRPACDLSPMHGPRRSSERTSIGSVARVRSSCWQVFRAGVDCSLPRVFPRLPPILGSRRARHGLYHRNRPQAGSHYPSLHTRSADERADALAHD